MANQRSLKFIIIITTLAISMLMAVIGSGVGFVFSFLIFGDGSELYWGLKKALAIEPYALVSIIFSITAFIATWIVAILILKNKIRRS